MKKKIVALSSLAMMMVLTTGCGGNEKQAVKKDANQVLNEVIEKSNQWTSYERKNIGTGKTVVLNEAKELINSKFEYNGTSQTVITDKTLYLTNDVKDPQAGLYRYVLKKHKRYGRPVCFSTETKHI